MAELSRAEEYLLEGIRQGQAEAWSQLVERYQGRLLAFARARLRDASAAEDLVQDTFIAFLRAAGDFRGESSLETYLFSILRRRIISAHRGRRLSVCLLQDVIGEGEGGNTPAAPDATASWYARRDEARGLNRAALAEALRRLIDGYKQSLNFRDLQIIEMLFYCRLRNKDIAEIAGVEVNHVAVIKHRGLRQIREHLGRGAEPRGPGYDAGLGDSDLPEDMLAGIWQEQRLSCLKRATVGAYLLGTLDEGWAGYVEFHLERLGCRFCRANLDDLRRQAEGAERRAFHARILESTVGFLSRP